MVLTNACIEVHIPSPTCANEVGAVQFDLVNKGGIA